MIKDFTKNKRLICGFSFLFGFLLGYILGILKIHNFFISYLNHLELWKFNFTFFEKFSQLALNADFLQDIITFEGVLIGVAIPISFQVVLSMVKEYDRDIAKIFIREPLYILQFILLLSNIIISLIFRFLQISNIFALTFMLIWAIVNIYFFVRFILLVHKYVTDTDKVILDKVWHYATNIFKK